MNVAVITPYYKEDLATLEKCHKSVLDQRIGCTHFFVADGHPNSALDEWDIKHIKFPEAHGDNGNTPRAIGGMLASFEGFDFVTYLDADNWYLDGHLDGLLRLHFLIKADVLCGFRVFFELDGTYLPYTEPIEDSRAHVDTSCLMLHRNAFQFLPLWAEMPRQLSALCDRVFLHRLIKSELQIASNGKSPLGSDFNMLTITPEQESTLPNTRNSKRFLTSPKPSNFSEPMKAPPNAKKFSVSYRRKKDCYMALAQYSCKKPTRSTRRQ